MKNTTSWLVFGLCSVGILGGIVAFATVFRSQNDSPDPQQAENKEDSRKKKREETLQALKGQWKVVSWRHTGREFRKAIGRRYTFNGTRLTVRKGNYDSHYDLVIDTNQSPFSMDMVMSEFGISRPAIFKLEGNRLTICQGSLNTSAILDPKTGKLSVESKSSRPTDFVTRGKWNLIVLERVKQ